MRERNINFSLFHPFSFKSCRWKYSGTSHFVLHSVSSVSLSFSGRQVSACNAPPWRPVNWYLSSFPGWNEEGALSWKFGRRSCKNAADTCPLHSWWLRLLMLMVYFIRAAEQIFKKRRLPLFRSKSKRLKIFLLFQSLLQRRDSFWHWILEAPSLRCSRLRWERGWGSGREEWRWRRRSTLYQRSCSMGEHQR